MLGILAGAGLVAGAALAGSAGCCVFIPGSGKFGGSPRGAVGADVDGGVGAVAGSPGTSGFGAAGDVTGLTPGKSAGAVGLVSGRPGIAGALGAGFGNDGMAGPEPEAGKAGMLGPVDGNAGDGDDGLVSGTGNAGTLGPGTFTGLAPGMLGIAGAAGPLGGCCGNTGTTGGSARFDPEAGMMSFPDLVFAGPIEGMFPLSWLVFGADGAGMLLTSTEGSFGNPGTLASFFVDLGVVDVVVGSIAGIVKLFRSGAGGTEPEELSVGNVGVGILGVAGKPGAGSSGRGSANVGRVTSAFGDDVEMFGGDVAGVLLLGFCDSGVVCARATASGSTFALAATGPRPAPEKKAFKSNAPRATPPVAAASVPFRFVG